MRRLFSRILLLFLCLAVLSMLGYGIFRSRYLEPLCQLAQAQAKNASLSLIEAAIGEQIENGTIQYDRIIFFEKDLNGRITALKTNMQEINRLKATILRQINRQILSLDSARIGIPVGSLILPAVFTGMGPAIPVHILSIRNSNASFLSHFSQAGINQTLHQLHLNILVEGTILVFGEIRSFTVSSHILVAETVIVGDVPNSFS